MPTAASKLDRSELRRDRRYAIPVFEVVVECEMFRSVDWSIGGVHLDGVCESAAVGALVDGWIALAGAPRAFAFSGRILRKDAVTGYTVVRFDDIDTDAAGYLDRAVTAHLH